MTAHLHLSHVNKDQDSKEVRLHYMPCVIKSDGEAKVSTYFEPVIRKAEDNGEILKASFRGYPLQGKKISLPENYVGVVLEETNCKISESCERNIYGKFTFDKFTYWNWDSEPSDDDKVVMALDWLDVAEAGFHHIIKVHCNSEMMYLPHQRDDNVKTSAQ